MTSNATLARADLAIADLDTNGGLLLPEQANQFIDMIFDEPTILPQARVVRMAAPEVKINRLGFGTRMLHGATETGSANDNGSNSRWLAAAKRSKPVTSQIVINSAEQIAEVRLPYEALEDNIEGQAFEAHIMQQIAQQVARDLEEFALWADTSIDPNTDDLLCLQDGWIKRLSSHVVDNTSAGISPDLMGDALLALPQKYLKDLASLKAFISVANTIKYRMKVAQRPTGFGDSALQGAIPLVAHGLLMEGAPMLAADNIGATGLVTYPQNLIFGIRRDISIETDKDIRSREYIIVVTLRVGLQIDDANAGVKLINI